MIVTACLPPSPTAEVAVLRRVEAARDGYEVGRNEARAEPMMSGGEGECV